MTLPLLWRKVITTVSIETMCITRKYPEYTLERHSIVIVLQDIMHSLCQNIEIWNFYFPSWESKYKVQLLAEWITSF